MTHLFAIFAVVQAAAWVPICVFFWRSWQERQNPISLAIFCLVAFAAFVGVGPYWMASGVTTRGIAELSIVGLDVVLLGWFYVAMSWSKKKFPDARHHPHHEDGNAGKMT